MIAASRPAVGGLQIIGLTIEREAIGGAVMDGMASFTSEPGNLDQLRDVTAEELGIQPVEITPAEALDRVVSAARRCGELGLRPTDDALLAVNRLVRASGIADAEEILARLPYGVPPQGADEDEFAESLEAWVRGRRAG